MERPRSASGGHRSSAASTAAANGGDGGTGVSGHGPSSGGGRRTSTSSLRPKVCRACGQHHSGHEPHLYNYKDEVDEDLMCQICLQPFVQPSDTPCSHTFCHACLNSYLRVNPMCPLDRKPVNEMTVSPSNLVLKRLLDKLLVTCPNADSCKEVLQRGGLDDHLRYRCSGTLVACQFAGAGCDYRGPSKSMNKHRNECKFKKEGITRLPILEGEVSHVEIPRTSQNLGVTIVGGADTPLRCVVVQEVYPDGLLAQDGRLQPGDQVIEINGVDMTCATHAQVCAALRKMSSVLRLGVYRERIEKYAGGSGVLKPLQQLPPQRSPAAQCLLPRLSLTTAAAAPQQPPTKSKNEELLTVTLERQPGRQLGIRLSGNCSEPGIFIVDIQDGSTTAVDGRLQKFDRLLFLNSQDVRHCRIDQASALIQNNDKVSIIVARKKGNLTQIENYDELEARKSNGSNLNGSGEVTNGIPISHTRSKSAPTIPHKHMKANGHRVDGDGGAGDGEVHRDEVEEEEDDEESDEAEFEARNERGCNAATKSRLAATSEEEDIAGTEHLYDVPEGEDYMAIYETLDRVKHQRGRRNQESAELKNKSHSMEALETPTPSLKSFEFPEVSESTRKVDQQPTVAPRKRHRSKPQTGASILRQSETRRSVHEMTQRQVEKSSNDRQDLTVAGGANVSGSMAAFLKKALRIEGPQLYQRAVAIKKNVRESLGMRIGGGIGSNEGDTPIYVANIHPHGCIGKSKQMKKGDLLLSVDEVSLCGLTHTQAVATLKATISRPQVVLSVMDGPETSFGASNFIPSWMYWQKLPRSLQYPKTVILHRRESASWGFSIVGGVDSNVGGRPTEPIHVLFVVPESPAAKDAKIKCGDRLLAVDGHTLENIPHSVAVSMLKQTSTRIVLEVVSWMGTEL